jgi:transposase
MNSGNTFSPWCPKPRNVRNADVINGVRAAGASRWATVKSSPALVYVLRTGCQWKALPKSFGSASSVHKHFQRWRGQGFFLALWQAGLAEYDEMEGIAWEWQSIDGTQGKAPLAQEAAGNNPADRGKKRQQAQPVGGRCWRPAVPYRQRGQPA